MWSLGVVLYELLTLKHPFQATSLITLIHNIMVSDPPPIENAYRFDECSAMHVCSYQLIRASRARQ